jgi:hypothetical protein
VIICSDDAPSIHSTYPIKPLPVPLRKPLKPPFCAPAIGCCMTPAPPLKTLLTSEVAPCETPSRAWRGRLRRRLARRPA